MIEAKKVVSIHYVLKDDDDIVIDSSEGQEPMTYLHGANNMIPGLESQLTGKAEGDKLDVVVEAAEAYGEYEQSLAEHVPKAAFAGVENIEAGMTFKAESDQGERSVVVIEVGEDDVLIDGNHPLAGKRLNFAVEIVTVREASEEEVAHGHVH